MTSSLRYLSVCSGIEAASVAWHPLGWTPVAFSEIEPFPSAVLAHRFPGVPNLGDMTAHATWPLRSGDIEILVGGTPCQSFSVAGLRRGLSDLRGGLMLTYLEIAQRLRPRWIVWENVPGVLSSGRGRDFGSFLGALGELGYGWAYRVLDAQWCRTHGHPRAVPQRRRRVFVVGCLGDWRAAAEVFFERESVRRHPAPRAASRQGAADDAKTGARAGRFADDVAPCLETTAHDYSRADCFTMIAQQVSGTLGRAIAKSRTELDNHGAYIPVFQPVAYDLFQITAPVNRQNRQPGDPCHTLARDNAAHAALAQAMTVRRLTPRECERLQGFPDDYTLIPWRKRDASDCPDGPRYKALGNSMAVNCMEWIGERIAAREAR